MSIHLNLPEDEPVSMPDFAADLLGMPRAPQRRPRLLPPTREQYLRDLRRNWYVELNPLDCLDPVDLYRLVSPLSDFEVFRAVQRVRRTIRKWLKAERLRGEMRSYLYDRGRHRALARAYERETAFASQIAMLLLVMRDGRGA